MTATEIFGYVFAALTAVFWLAVGIAFTRIENNIAEIKADFEAGL